MVLNLLRVDDINPEFMLERSFRQFQSHCEIPALVKKLKELKGQIEKQVFERENELQIYYNLDYKIRKIEMEIQQCVMMPENFVKFLVPGRLVYIKNKQQNFGWAVVLNHIISKKTSGSQKVSLREILTKDVKINVLLKIDEKRQQTTNVNDLIAPTSLDAPYVLKSIQVSAEVLFKISQVTINIPDNVDEDAGRKTVKELLENLSKKYGENIPEIDPRKDMKVTGHHIDSLFEDLEMTRIAFKLQTLTTTLPDFEQIYKKFEHKNKLKGDLAKMREIVQEKQSLLLINELKSHKKVLRKLNYIDEADVVQIKGRVACEISCADPLITTELLFDKFFEKLTPAQITSVLSVLVFQEKGDPYENLSPELLVPYNKVMSEVRKIARVSSECDIQIDEQNFAKQFSCGLMQTMYQWAMGHEFNQCITSNNFEGSVVRCMRRMIVIFLACFLNLI